MKLMMAVGFLLALSACATEHGPMNNLSISMIALNHGQPFVSRGFADRLALLVIDEKDPRDVFSVRGSGSIVDKGDSWSVTFDNALIDPADKDSLPILDGRVVRRRLTITIRKANGEVISIT
jgi:hypothetical protein